MIKRQITTKASNKWKNVWYANIAMKIHCVQLVEIVHFLVLRTKSTETKGFICHKNNVQYLPRMSCCFLQRSESVPVLTFYIPDGDFTRLITWDLPQLNWTSKGNWQHESPTAWGLIYDVWVEVRFRLPEYRLDSNQNPSYNNNDNIIIIYCLLVHGITVFFMFVRRPKP